MPSPHLPFEIIEKILIKLVRKPLFSNSRNPDFLACALVSPAWLGPARMHMWYADWFEVPRTEPRFTELKRLCSSTLCTLRLDQVERLWADLHNPVLAPFFEWCPSVFTRVNYTMIKARHTTTIPPLLFTELWEIRFLELVGVRLESPNELYELLLSMKELDSLTFRDVSVKSKQMKGPDRALIMPRILRLHVDSDSFFELLYRRVGFSGVQDLTFYDNYFSNRRSVDDAPCIPWRAIGDMLTCIGKRLLRLELRLFRIDKTKLSGWDMDRLDLPNQAPMLKKLRVDVGGNDRDNLLIPILSSKDPHPNLAIVEIASVPHDPRTLDHLLEKCAPSLRALKFDSVGIMIKRCEDGLWCPETTNPHRQGSKKHSQWLGNMMPRHQCLFHVRQLCTY